jgi:hypothetical protein
MLVPCEKCEAPHATIAFDEYTHLRLCRSCTEKWRISLVHGEVRFLIQTWLSVKIPVEPVVVDMGSTEE